MQENDFDMRLAEMRETAVEWANEREIVIGPDYIDSQFNEGINRLKYGDVTGASICMLRSNSVMIAASYTLDQIMNKYIEFNKEAKTNLFVIDTESTFSSMDNFYEGGMAVKKELSPKNAHDLVEKESLVLRASLFHQSSYEKQITKLVDKIREKIDSAISQHDCNKCKKEKGECPVYNSGVYKAIERADRTVKGIIVDDILKLEKIILTQDIGKWPIDRIKKSYSDEEDIDSRFSLTASSAMMIMMLRDLPIEDCAVIHSIISNPSKYEHIAIENFIKECDDLGIGEDDLNKIVYQDMSPLILGEIVESLKSAIMRAFDKKIDSDKNDETEEDEPDEKKEPQKSNKVHRPGEVKFGKN